MAGATLEPRRRGLRAAVGTAAVALALLAVGPGGAAGQATDGRYRQFGDAGGFRNILPPGQDGVIDGPEQFRWQAGERDGDLAHVADQLELYADLLDRSPGLSEDDLDALFKDASFGVAPGDVGRVYHPGGRGDVTVIRDASHGVPHIFGDTRTGTFFAKGYTTAEDRLFLMDVLRHTGRARLSEFLGPTEFNQQTDRDQLAVAPYREEDLTRQTEPRSEFGELGQQIRADGEAYIAGVNRYVAEARQDPSKLPAEYPALQKLPEDFVLEDIVAIASLVGGIFGGGGGGELRNYCGIAELGASLGDPGEARAVFDDLKLGDDAEAPPTTTKRFPYMSTETLGPVDPAAVPPIDCTSLRPIEDSTPSVDDVLDAVESRAPGAGPTRVVDGPSGPIVLDLGGASNAVLVAGGATATGTPIAVLGPQTGYFVPQLLTEADVHGPDIDVRGIGFAGIDVYVQIGRGQDFAWSATTSRADAKDTFVLELCEPEGGEPTVASMGHRHDGACVPIEGWNHTQVAAPTAAGSPESPEDVVLSWRVERSPVYGPLVARGRLEDGTPIGVAVYRSTYFRETMSAPSFHLLNSTSHMASGFEGFREAFGDFNEFSFNWFYVDRDTIGYQSSCRCPRRVPGVDPYLPTWGTGSYDWARFLGKDEIPWEQDPDRGWIISWNNRQAPGFWTDDRQFSAGPVDRSQLLQRRAEPLVARGGATLPEVVDVTAEAATTDLRSQELLPVLVRLLGDHPPSGLDARVGDMWQRLRRWTEDRSGHRRDRDGDGAYEHATAIAILDAWWPHLVDAVLGASTGGAITALQIPIHDPPQLHLGSAFNTGAWGQVHKDLRRVMGEPVADPFHRTYCGGGDRAACRADVWGSLEAAIGDLEATFGSGQVASWQRRWQDDAIVHMPAGIAEVRDLHWQNRPTFQQIVQLPPAGSPPTDGAPGDDDAASAAPDTPGTGGGRMLLPLVVLAAAVALLVPRRRGGQASGG